MGEIASRHRPLVVLGILLVVVIAILVAMGRPPICTCGTVDLWGQVGPQQSQMLADWYSPSHFIHGLIFYAILWKSAPGWSIERRFLVALLVEAAWEIAENTPLVIDRYREATMALGYSGDSILNSVSDIIMMALGFLAARRLPVWAERIAGDRAGVVHAGGDPRQSDAQRVDAAVADRLHPRVARRRCLISCWQGGAFDAFECQQFKE